MSDNTNSTAAKPTMTRRNISMAFFKPGSEAATKQLQKDIIDGKTVKLGQIIGSAYKAKEETQEDPDGGNARTSIRILGDFEAMNAFTGEIVESGNLFLPKYFAEQVGAALEANKGSVEFGINIWMEPNPKADRGGVIYRYAVENLLGRKAGSPLEMVKRAMAKAGTLALPAPAEERPLLEGAFAGDDGPEAPTGEQVLAGEQAPADPEPTPAKGKPRG